MPVNKDLEIIKQLEEALKIKIPELKEDEEIEWDTEEDVVWGTVGYTLDAEDKVNGLNLYLCKVQTKHLELIGRLGSLQVLFLDSNQITEIEGLDNLTNLQWLELGGNQITDGTPLGALLLNQKKAGKPILDISTSLRSNPLQAPPIEVIKEGSEAFLEWVEENKIDSR
jgi:hypothetical protein